jgi:nucleoside-diphosphate-sugar epimerase
MLKILILGGAGYLGSVLVPILLENGDDVTVLDNFRYSGDSLLNYSENLCDEDSIISPLSQYAKIKTEAERIIIEQPNTIALRLGTLFGVSSRMRMDLLINNLVYRAIYDKYAVLNAPTAFRNYLHVRDAANVFMFAIKYFSKMKGNVYNVGHIDLNLSQEDICLIIKKEIPNFYYFTHIENDLIAYPTGTGSTISR